MGRPKGYWSKIENRRQFFTDFAKEASFDPLVPENWSSVTRAHILAGGKVYMLPYSCIFLEIFF